MKRSEQIEKIFSHHQDKDTKATRLLLWRQAEILRLVRELENEIHVLRKKELELQALEEAGVDNWEGYSIAQDIYDNMLDESDYPFNIHP